jgi:hypothetical protein
MAVLPSPPPVEYIALALLFYIGGLVTPWYYAQERMRGFGRWLAAKIPYEPPPGEESGKAMERAVEAGEASPDEVAE